ncbi:hypothetical protein FACS189426_13620 [Bacteroidia bacterium]|nr:hypothetical protein FACS189426_13620 [Bacteroidia bacterium]GHT86124.1 hypothetical protein FACS18947_5700 [Bacteroidia bacterium]GHV70467.1 hypothetical protein FACS189420_1680 [Bacteroidia bacterium]
MKKDSIIKKAILLFCLAGIVYACINEHDLLDQDDGQLTVSEAQQWYESNLKGAAIELRAGGKDSKIKVKPNWTRSYTKKDKDYETVEVGLASNRGFGFFDTESKEKFDETQDSRYLKSITRLITRKNRKTNETDGFLMTIIPDLAYLESTKFEPFKQNYYLERDKKFTGHILFHNLDGDFVNGWGYKDGKLYTVSNPNDDSPKLELRTAPYCDSWCVLSYITTINNSYVAEREVVIMPNTYVYEYYCYSRCDGGDGGNGGDGGEGLYIGGGGSGGNGGGNENGYSAPKAKALFKNGNLSDAQWKKVEDWLNKILKDCVGNKLYAALSANGKSYSITFDSGSSGAIFSYLNNAFVFGNNSESNYFFHEMWHAYQHAQETNPPFYNAKINMEIEAHYAQYLYIKSQPEYKTNSKWAEWYTKDPLLNAIVGIDTYINAKGVLNSGQTSTGLDNYLKNDVITAFRNYKNGSGQNVYNANDYKYDANRKGTDNFKYLQTLSKDC